MEDTRRLTFKKKFVVRSQLLNPLPLMSDQEGISPHNINTISSIEVMRIKQNINKGSIS